MSHNPALEPDPAHEPESPEDASAPGAETPEGEQPPKTNFLGFVLVPAVLVMAAVGLVWFFLYLTADRRTFQDYSTQLRSADKAERWQAALDLVDSNRTSPELIPILIEILDAPNEEQKLIQTGWNPRDILRSPEEKEINLRWYATAALGSIGGPEATAKLIELTSDSDDGVRLYAVHGLARIRDPQAAPRLMEVLKSDEDGSVRATAAFALGEIADPQAVPALRTAHAEDLHIDVRWNAAIALARFEDESARPTLEAMIASPQSNASSRTEARNAIRILDRAKTRK